MHMTIYFNNTNTNKYNLSIFISIWWTNNIFQNICFVYQFVSRPIDSEMFLNFVYLVMKNDNDFLL